MARIGFAVCGVCGFPEASISKTNTGTLTMRCHRCEFSGFAKVGTKAARAITTAIKPDPDAGTEQGEAKPAAPPAAKSDKPTPAAAPRAAFSLEQLTAKS